MTQWTITPEFIGSAIAHRLPSLDAAFDAKGERVTHDKISEVLRLDCDGTRYYLKRYTGRGLHVRRLLWVTRVESEWRNLLHFARWGVPTADVVGYGQQRELGVFMRGAMITREISDTFDLLRLARQHPETLRARGHFDRICQQLARIVRTLHAHRFTHNDLHWRNVLYRPSSGEVFLIDCPNGHFWRWPVLGYRIVKDLASLDKIARQYLTRTARLRFLLAYRGITSLDPATKKLARQVLRAHSRRALRKQLGF